MLCFSRAQPVLTTFSTSGTDRWRTQETGKVHLSLPLEAQNISHISRQLCLSYSQGYLEMLQDKEIDMDGKGWGTRKVCTE